MARVLVAGDAGFRAGVARALSGGADVAGAVEVAELVAAVRRWQPELVLVQDGPGPLAEVVRCMHTCPSRILVMGDGGDADLEVRAVAAGALDAIASLPPQTDPAWGTQRNRLLRRITVLATVPVVRRTGPAPAAAQTPEWVLIGSSTGGPQALEVVLGKLPRPFPKPVVLAQHVTAGFDGALADWLTTATGHTVRVVDGRCAPEPGCVYLAPESAHLVVRRPGVLGLEEGPPRNFHRPSIDALFESAAAVLGPRVFAALLTGMGSDGAAGMLALRRAGSITVAQHPSTCVVDSMPQAAIGLGAAGSVGTLEQIAAMIGRLAPPPGG